MAALEMFARQGNGLAELLDAVGKLRVDDLTFLLAGNIHDYQSP